MLSSRLARPHAVLLTALLAGCALAHESGPTDTPPDDTPPDDTPPSTGTWAALELAWATETEMAFGRHSVHLAPGGEIVARPAQFGGSVFVAETGERIGSSEAYAAIDAEWRHAVASPAHGRIAAIELATGSEVVTSELDHLGPAPIADIDPAGEWLVSLECQYEEPATLVVARLSGHGARRVELDGTCAPSYVAVPIVRTDGRVAAVAGGSRNTVDVVDLETGDVRSRTLEVGPTDLDRIGPSESGIAEAVLSPDGERLAVVTTDGRLHLLDTTTLETVREHAVGVFVANRETYLPSVASPVAFHPDGRHLAHVDAEGRVAILHIGDGTLVQTLDTPFATDPDEPWIQRELPMVLSFVDDGLLGSFEGGVARWVVEGTALASRAAGTLEVAVDAPTRVTAGDPIEVVARTDASSAVRWIENGSRGYAQGSLDAIVTTYLHEPGTHRFTVVVSDGARIGHADWLVEVLPREE